MTATSYFIPSHVVCPVVACNRLFSSVQRIMWSRERNVKEERVVSNIGDELYGVVCDLIGLKEIYARFDGFVVPHQTLRIPK